jgi:hypothetical protein
MLFTSFFISCQKETNFDDTPTPATDSNYLDKIYDLYDDGSGIDTQQIISFHYDNQKRVSSFEDRSTTDPNAFRTFEYYYNGTDSLPFKSVTIDREGMPPMFNYDTITTFHFFDAQQRKLMDSSVRVTNNSSFISVEQKVVHYSYAAGKLFGETSTILLTGLGTITKTRDSADLNSNGDITTNKKYLFNGTSYELNTTSVFTYDSHPNAFAKLSLFPVHRQFPNGETLYFEYLGHNNILTQDEITVTPTYNFSWNKTYTYNNAGFPLIETYVATVPEIWHYTYKSL